MNFSKKTHKLVGQNEGGVKKPHKHDVNLQKNSTLYFQVGLILTLLAVYGMFELQFQVDPYESVVIASTEEPDVIYKNYIPEVPQEPIVEKKVEPQKQPLLALHIREVKNDTPEIEITKEEIITEVPTKTVTKSVKVVPSPKPPVTNNSPMSFRAVEKVPVYPGCEGLSTREEFTACMSEKIGKLVNRKFDVDAAADAGLTGRQNIYVQFKIDKNGNVVDIQARAKHSKLEREAIKVIERIPQMTPGQQRDRNVEVIYNLPIRLQLH